MVSCVLMTSFIFVWKAKIKHRQLYVLIIILVSSFFGISYIIENIEDYKKLYHFFDAISSGELDGSTRTRLNQLLSIEHKNITSLIFGGVDGVYIIENAYGAYFSVYGALGLCTYISSIAIISYHLSRKYLLAKVQDFEIKTIAARYGLLWLFLSIFIFSLGSAPMDGHKIGTFVWIILGYYLAAFRNR